ncbi:MAG: potassium-transporting ATPase subunit KdpB [Anaerolineae bacterium]
MAARSLPFSIPTLSFQHAFLEAFRKLNPRYQLRNPLLFAVEMGSVTLTLLWLAQVVLGSENPRYALSIALWLWLTLWLANFAEALAEGRGRTQAETLRFVQRDVVAKKLTRPEEVNGAAALSTGEWVVRALKAAPDNRPMAYEQVAAAALRVGSFVLVEAGDVIPGDGEVVAGAAAVDESAITGGSTPVIREGGCSVTGGTRVLSDWLVVRITNNPGDMFIDRMITLVQGAKRQKTPRELLLNVVLVGISIVFLLATTALLLPLYRAEQMPFTLAVLFALLVCLIPTTIGSLFPTVGIVGMDRMMQANVVALSGRAVEAAGKVDMLLLDKTGTITWGNRQATAFIAVDDCTLVKLAEAAVWASCGDDTAEGRSITILAKERYGVTAPPSIAWRGRETADSAKVTVVPFSAQTRMSGVEVGGRSIRKGAPDAIEAYLTTRGGHFSAQARAAIDSIAQQGGTPLVVAEAAAVLGVIHLKDTVKAGMRERFAELRGMGIRTVMVTGDNPLTAASIAVEAGIDDFMAQASPEDKLRLIRQAQTEGKLIAMTGDGTNDAPALAQADVALTMNTGTQAAKEAGNMIDLDSNPTKLIEIVKIGKQMLNTRSALTLFCVTSDVAKYVMVVPAVFAMASPALGWLNLMGLHTAQSALLSAVIFNALMVVLLIPLALRGMPQGALRLRVHLLRYGVGGFVTPFVAIKLIDVILTTLRLV